MAWLPSNETVSMKLILLSSNLIAIVVAKGPIIGSVCVCVCVIFLFILDIKFVGCTSQGHTGFVTHLLSAVRALIFLARRIQPFLSLVDREVEFRVLTIYSFSTGWAFSSFVFSFLVIKIPFAGIELTSQRVRGLRGTSELPGRPASK